MESPESFVFLERLRIEKFLSDGYGLTLHASTIGGVAVCPLCGQASRRIHGRYARTLADLPWCGIPVRIQVQVRKFFCDEASCQRKIFAERLEKSARPFARATDRQREALEWIAFALGGEAGARLARELGLLVSPDTLLNRIRGALLASDAENGKDVRVVGVDDFGFKRDNDPATIMVDLERHKIVDLLQGHSTEPIARWLSQRSGSEVVARDRSYVCKEGIYAGAPKAKRVTDRWHLLHNLTQVLENFLLTKRTELKKAVKPETTSETTFEEPDTSEAGREDSVPSTEVPDIRLYEQSKGRP
ncbi:MAG: ISL3 family transposase [Rubrobacteraceae bacterium]